MTDKPKDKGGRPSTGLDTQMMLRVSPAWLKIIDDWREQQPNPLPRSEAIRILVEHGIRHWGRRK